MFACYNYMLLGDSLASIQLHPVDAGPHVPLYQDPRPKKKLPADYNLRLDDDVDSTPTIGNDQR